MVKLGFYIIKKRGKKMGLRKYEEVCLHFPKELHELLRCLRDKNLEVKAAKEGNIIHITLTEKK